MVYVRNIRPLFDTFFFFSTRPKDYVPNHGKDGFVGRFYNAMYKRGAFSFFFLMDSSEASRGRTKNIYIYIYLG